jgi:hypothetical protein
MVYVQLAHAVTIVTNEDVTATNWDVSKKHNMRIYGDDWGCYSYVFIIVYQMFIMSFHMYLLVSARICLYLPVFACIYLYLFVSICFYSLYLSISIYPSIFLYWYTQYISVCLLAHINTCAYTTMMNHVDYIYIIIINTYMFIYFHLRIQFVDPHWCELASRNPIPASTHPSIRCTCMCNPNVMLGLEFSLGGH